MHKFLPALVVGAGSVDYETVGTCGHKYWNIYIQVHDAYIMLDQPSSASVIDHSTARSVSTCPTTGDSAGQKLVEHQTLLSTQGKRVKDIQSEITKIYQEFRPEKVSGIPSLMQSFQGNELKLLRNVNTR